LEYENELPRLMVNELLQVQCPDEGYAGIYRSRIEDIVEEKLMVAWPSDGGFRLPVHLDQMLDFSLVRNNNAYTFSGMVDGTSDEPLPLVTIIISSAIQRVQRRQDFRVKCLLPIEVIGTLPETSKEASKEPDAEAPKPAELAEPTPEAPERPEASDARPVTLRLKTHTYDLSASGVSIRSEAVVPDGALLNVKISLPDDGPLMRIPCQATHCSVVPENPNIYHAGIRFLGIDEKDKARIVRFVYRTQLQGLRS